MSEPGRDALMTYDEHSAMPDDGHRYQLLEGELVMTPSPTRWHQVVSIQLGAAPLQHVAARGMGEVITPGGDVFRVRTVTAYDEAFRPALFPEFRPTVAGLR